MTSPLTALSPLDGRYSHKIEPLKEFFSEKALMYYRVRVEISWIQFLSDRNDIEELRAFTEKEKRILENITENFSEGDAEKIKSFEKTTNHDVKAVEYFLKEKFAATSLKDVVEWIHFACTSEDVNNLAYAMMLRDAIRKCLLPAFTEVADLIGEKSREWKGIPMLARTHGQPASPTTVGKALFNFYARLRRELAGLEGVDFLGKINGATGNYNAHVVAFPKVNWLEISKTFVEILGLTWQPISDQIEPHDFIAKISHNIFRLNTICTDFSRDIWGYIAIGYFKQKLKEGEVGSSTMPHKVNPIDFENSEGNFGIANALFHLFAERLPISRWQRDLTDSTLQRNIGVAFGHTLLSLSSLSKGIQKLEVNTTQIEKDLEENIEVLSEAVQTVMRKYGVEHPYEKLKELTRGKRITRKEYEKFVGDLKIPKEAKDALQNLTPQSYTGIAEEIVEKFG
ncbi:adenylosuccinate lyase [Candidatus Peregrinibacteria bacterium]|nr:adenylosuccinate lyase [Candidatus Peregrinibacteria bacterium]